MKNNTLFAAMKLGFDMDQYEPNITLAEIYEDIMSFLFEHENELPKEYAEVEVSQHGNSQSVSFGDFVSSGEIIQWRDYWYQPRKKIEHSSFVTLADDGTPYTQVLWCWSKNEDNE